MNEKLYVGGLPYATTEDQLQDVFAAHGTVVSARIITDKSTGRSRGFGFVEMGSADEAQQATGTAGNGSLQASFSGSVRSSRLPSDLPMMMRVARPLKIPHSTTPHVPTISRSSAGGS